MLTPTTAILVGAVALIIFGPKQLPELAKSLGKAMGEFKKGINGEPDPQPTSLPAQADAIAPSPAPAAPAAAHANAGAPAPAAPAEHTAIQS